MNLADLVASCRALLLRRRVRDDLADEIQTHLDEKRDALVDDGLSREEATFAARRAFGNVTLTAERGWDVWAWPSVEAWVSDVRYAWRVFRAHPSFALVAIISSALGIGAATAVFAVVYGVLIDPYPYRDTDRLVHLHVFNRGALLFDLPLSSQEFQDFQDVPILDGAMAMDVESMARTDTDFPELVNAGFLSPNAFEFLGVGPFVGRVFTPHDATDPFEPQRVAVLSYQYWQTHFGAERDIVGRTLAVDHQSYAIVGVMPPRFAWWNCDVYLPLQRSSDPNRLATVFARLKPGVRDAQAEPTIRAIVERFASDHPNRFPDGFDLHFLHMNQIAAGQIAGALTVTGAAVGGLLLIAFANVTILLLAHSASKTEELAVRVALGATRTRLMRQLLTESIVISLAGGVIGLLMARPIMELMPRLLPEGTFPSEATLHVNGPVIAFGLAVALLAGVLFGWASAFTFSRPALQALRGSASAHAVPRPVKRHDVLVVGQVALTLVLLAGAIATARAFEALLATKLEYDPQDVASIRVDLRDGTYTSWRDRVDYFDRIRRSVAESPDVISTAISVSDLPPATPFHSSRIELFDQTPTQQSVAPRTALLAKVSDDYFATLRIPVLRGTPWNHTDTLQAAPVAVVNATMAHVWPDGSAINQIVRLPDLHPTTTWALDRPAPPGTGIWVRIVGVVADTPNNGLANPVAPMLYVPYSLVIDDSFRLIVKASAAPLTVARLAAEKIQAVDPDQPISQVHTAVSILDAEGWARERFTASIFAAFAVVAVLLASVGLYSVVSYVVAQRTQEFGIRMALGARRWDVMNMVWTSAMSPTIIGIAVGLALCLMLNAQLIAWAHASVRDASVLGPVILLLMAVTTIAALIPAFRAASVEPMSVLRRE